MTQKIIGLIRWIALRTILLVAVLCSTACHSVFDDDEDCTPYYYMKFVYDMHMEYGDAFAKQVSSVDLYVFDAETGEYITHFTEAGDALASENYKMPLNLAPGKYKFIAWCGLGTPGNFDFSLTNVANIKTEADLKCTMNRTRGIIYKWNFENGTYSYSKTDGAYSNRNLHPLFHGATVEVLPDQEGEHIYVVKLTRDTNNINLSLHHTSGALDLDRFDIVMADENGFLAHDNSPLTDEIIEYRPWDMRTGTVDISGSMAKARAEGDDLNSEEANEDKDKNSAGFLIAEISTSRLMKDHEQRIYVIDKEKEEVIFSIPMVQWALMFRSSNHASMDEQEYLDRENEYNLMVFLADNVNKEDGWMAVSIFINGWHMITGQDDEVLE